MNDYKLDSQTYEWPDYWRYTPGDWPPPPWRIPELIDGEDIYYSDRAIPSKRPIIISDGIEENDDSCKGTAEK